MENKNDLEIQRKDPNCPLYSVKSFEELNLQPNLLKGVYAMGFNAPSKIQVLLPLCCMADSHWLIVLSLGNSFADAVGGPSTEHDRPVAIWDGQDCCICACNALQGQHRPQTPPGRKHFRHLCGTQKSLSLCCILGSLPVPHLRAGIANW